MYTNAASIDYVGFMRDWCEDPTNHEMANSFDEFWVKSIGTEWWENMTTDSPPKMEFTRRMLIASMY